jgi:predicted TIM-barrel fold metal-dependent hydrolase
MREFGWHAKIHAQPDELRDMLPLLRRVRIPIVIDHMAKLDFDEPLDHPDTRFVLEALRHENWWIMLSNGMRHTPPPWDGAITYGKALYEAAPDRSIWGSDWPHLGMHGPEISEDADHLELVYQYAPTAEGRRNVLVTNPAKLFGFDD